MKKTVLPLAIILLIILLTSCSNEPLFTVYGDNIDLETSDLHKSYRILELYNVEKDGEPTLHHICLINDGSNNIDIMYISYSKANDNYAEYVSRNKTAINNAELGKLYSTGKGFKDITVEYIICEEKDIPQDTLQHSEFDFNEKTLYLCIISVTAK